MLESAPQLSADLAVAGRLAVACLAGFGLGLEREWSGHASGPAGRFAGVRTFTLLGLLGGAAGWLIAAGLVPVGVTLLAGGAALTVAAYVAAARPGGEAAVDGTTEAAALVALALGTFAGLGAIALAGGTTAVVMLTLREKARVHALVRRIDDAELRGGVQFAVLALVVLPLLPNAAYGPLGGVNPRTLWSVVLLFTGLDFAGYLARRAAGTARGYGITGLLGGLVSSTALTLDFARRSRRAAAAGDAPSLAGGVVAACTVLLPRVTVVAAVLEPRVAWALVPYLLPPFAVGAAVVLAATRRQRVAALPPHASSGGADYELRNPLRLGAAVRMAALLQLVLFALTFARETWGGAGVLTSATFLGLTNMDALVLSMSRIGTTTPAHVALAAQAIALGVLANTLFKLGLAVAVGTGSFRGRAAAGLAALAAASGAGLWALSTPTMTASALGWTRAGAAALALPAIAGVTWALRLMLEPRRATS